MILGVEKVRFFGPRGFLWREVSLGKAGLSVLKKIPFFFTYRRCQDVHTPRVEFFFGRTRPVWAAHDPCDFCLRIHTTRVELLDTLEIFFHKIRFLFVLTRF